MHAMHKIKSKEEQQQIQKFRPKITDLAFHHTDNHIHTQSDREKKRRDINVENYIVALN